MICIITSKTHQLDVRISRRKVVVRNYQKGSTKTSGWRMTMWWRTYLEIIQVIDGGYLFSIIHCNIFPVNGTRDDTISSCIPIRKASGSFSSI